MSGAMTRLGRIRLAVVAAFTALSLTGCAFGTAPDPAPSGPPLPRPTSAANLRALDVCGLLPEKKLAEALPAAGSVPVHREVVRLFSECSVYAAVPHTEAGDPGYVVSEAFLPTVNDWQGYFTDKRATRTTGGWTVNLSSPERSVLAISPRGLAFRIRTYQGPAEDDMHVDETKIAQLLLATLAGAPQAPTIAWQHGGLLAADICTVVQSHLAPRLETDHIPAQTEALTPDRRNCDDAADRPSPSNSRFTVEASRGYGVGNPIHPRKAVIAGHQAIVDDNGGTQACRIAVTFPDDPALGDRQTPGYQGIQLYVGAPRKCAVVMAATGALVAALDKS